MYDNIEKYLEKNEDAYLVIEEMNHDPLGNSEFLVYIHPNGKFKEDYPFIYCLYSHRFHIEHYAQVFKKYLIPMIISTDPQTGLQTLDARLQHWNTLEENERCELYQSVNYIILHEEEQWYQFPLGRPGYGYRVRAGEKNQL